MPRYSLAALALAGAMFVTTTATHADEITDTLDAARAAYDAGDITSALEELSFAQSMLQDLRLESLTKYLPEPPDGWTLEVSSEMGSVLAFTGGGIGAQGTYSGDGESFDVQIMVDSPMMTAMAGLVANPMIAKASGGKLHRVGTAKVLEMDNNLTTIVANRILITASGASKDVMMPVFETIDFDALTAFRP